MNVSGGSAPLDAVIVTVPFWGVKMPPLGAAYVAASAESAGYRIRLYDLNVECFHHLRERPEMARLWETNPSGVRAQEAANAVFRACLPLLDRFIDELRERGCPLVGFSLNTRNRDFGNQLARRIRERLPAARILFGGPECYAQQQMGLMHQDEAELFCVGEGEQAFVEVLGALRDGRSPEGIPGIVCRLDGPALSRFVPRRPEMKLDRLPYPTYTGLPLEKYSTRRMPMLISRGCVCHCRFCVDYILNSPYRFRGPAAVVEEMRYHLETNGSGDFAFNDLLCNGNMKQLEQLCDMIVESGLPVRWDSYAIVRKEMTPAILAKMKSAGCLNLCYGTESGSDRVLKLMGKFSSSDVSRQNLRDTHAAGIRTSLNIIVGYPGETEEEFEKTLEFLEECSGWIDEVTNVSSLVVMPGTALRRDPKQYGIEYIDEGDSWADDRGSTPAGRGERVARVMRLIAERGLGSEIVNHDPMTALSVPITIVVPCDARPPRRAAWEALARYPFEVALAGDGLEGLEPEDRLQVMPREPGTPLARAVDRAVERAAGRYVWLAAADALPSRALLFEAFRAMESASELHFLWPGRGRVRDGVLASKPVLLQLGGLDPSFGPDSWIADLLMRGQLWGYRIASLLPLANAAAPAPRAPEAGVQRAKDGLELFLKHYPRALLRRDAAGVLTRLGRRLLPVAGDPLSPLRQLAGFARSLAQFPRWLHDRRRILCAMQVPEREAERLLRPLEEEWN